MAFWLEGLQLLVWQRAWSHASVAAVVCALAVYVALAWVGWVLARTLLDLEFSFNWQAPAWLRGLFFWLGFFAFLAMGAALGWWLNQWPVYAEDEPLMIVGAGLGALAYQALSWRYLRPRVKKA